MPGKNVKILGGRPLIAWTLQAALDSQVILETLVSTDDPTIAEVAQRYGGVVPGLRPAHLATDTASSVDVVLHVLNDFETQHGAVDGVMLLQPTSPFRTAESIRQAVALFHQDRSRPVVSVCAASIHPAWCFRFENGAMEPFMGWEPLVQRSQDLEPAFTLNGSIYLIAPQVLREQQRFLCPGTVPLVIPDGVESLDIDTADDWDAAVNAVDELRSR
ncbi:UNVERIFIED_ORG: N-acylneuraminate cytidylyltransferase/CMP-N,N'-diacetyllegionaminic acid synthase [Pseudomonas lini]|uniref:Acylneuraminate cytidylyltransferase family protein n=1 Tax=Pseudomonas viciae TaxID=2505979 RepID=A0ABY8PIP7_9PSED|nr:acylneuraminate cytidylyltransferase family protein [Pseudomonas viciae]UZE88098.1 acylneuraminate cytidylyltransferase family protein [Pseudomonas viciae]WGO95078.1 acylneuraminate cytidylyltransferase family protein [Pseudomonas viciae]